MSDPNGEDLSPFEFHLLRNTAQLSPDWFLQVFVKMCNEDDDLQIGVTLNVGGHLVCGKLVGGRVYMRKFGETFGRAAKGLTSEEESNRFGRIGEAYYPRTQQEAAEDGGKGDDGGPSFVHLINCRFYHGDVQVPADFEGLLWRGRLTAVDGFMLGELGPRQ